MWPTLLQPCACLPPIRESTPRRIAIMGFSRGGVASWRTAVERIIAAQQLPEGLRFAAHIQVYSAGCTGIFRLIVKPGVFSKAPELWIHGDADDYTPIGACQDYSKRIGEAGTPVEFVGLPGVYHKFDDDDQRRITVRGAQRTVENCPLEMDINTLATYDRNTGQRLSGVAFLKAVKSCSALGATVQGNRFRARQGGAGDCGLPAQGVRAVTASQQMRGLLHFS